MILPASGIAGPAAGYRPTAIQPDAVLGPTNDLMALLAQSQPLEPKYPSWLYVTDPDTGERILKPPKMPDSARFQDWVTGDAMRWGETIARFYDDLMTYRRLGVAVSGMFNPDTDTAFISDEAAIQVNKVAAMIAGTPHSITYKWGTAKERKQAQAMEAFALWFLEQWDYWHRQQGNHDLKWDLVWSSLIYGRQVVQVNCDLDDGSFPWLVKLHDPATVFPFWGHGKQGLLRATIRYTTTIGDVLDEYDPTGEDGLSLKLGARKKGEKESAVDYDVEGTYTEVWTRWQKYAEFDGHELVKAEHEYGEVPIIYNLAIGEMGGTATPIKGRRTGLTRQQILAGYGRDTERSRQRDMAEKGVSFLHAVKNTLYQRDKFLSMHATAAEQGINPAYFIENPWNQMPEAFDFGPGGINELKAGQRPIPVVNSPRPLDSQPLLATLNNELSKGLLPDVIFGAAEGSNITGFAADSMMNAAKDVITPYVKLTENTLADTIMLAARLFRNFGHLAEGLEGGQLVIPRQQRGGARSGAQNVPATPPPWAMPIMEKMLNFVSDAPQQPQPPQIPGGPGMVGSDVPGAPMVAGQAPAGAAMLGLPGYADPRWGMDGVPQDDEPDFIIDAATIDAISARPKVQLTLLGLTNRTVLANYVDMLVKGNLMSPETAMDQLPEIQDAVAETEKILAHQAKNNPDSLRLVEYPKALWQQGDMASFFVYWATVLLPAMQAGIMQAMGRGGASPSGPAPEGEPPPGAGPPGRNPEMVQGDSAAMLGAGPGRNGAPVGRPG